MSAFLDAAEVEHLTGRKQPAAQARFLRARRIRHYVNARGIVVIARAWLDLEPDGRDAAPDRVRPNLAALKV